MPQAIQKNGKTVLKFYAKERIALDQVLELTNFTRRVIGDKAGFAAANEAYFALGKFVAVLTGSEQPSANGEQAGQPTEPVKDRLDEVLGGQVEP